MKIIRRLFLRDSANWDKIEGISNRAQQARKEEALDMKLEVGNLAPEFALPDQAGVVHRLSDFRGKKTVVYFYPKDDTPGCTRQACAFRDSIGELRDLNAVVIGISKDSTEAHRKFIEKYNLPFLLLSDPERSAIEAYGVWQEKKNYGKVSMGVVRMTFVLDEEGRILKIFPKAKPDTNAAEIVEFLKK